jgi:hypothetical protein
MDGESKSPVVLLLGAGASVDAGCPTVEMLVSRFEQFVSKHGTDRDLTAFRELCLILRQTKPVREQGVLVDVELILSTLVQLLQLDEDPLAGFVRNWNRAVRANAAAWPRLLKMLQEHIRAECTIEPQRVDYLRPLRDFVDHYGRLDVFSLNYDAAVEIVCQQEDIPYTDGFDLYWNPIHFLSDVYRLRLFKLHGSLLWFETDGHPRKLVKIPVKPEDAGGFRFFTDEGVSNVLMYPAFVKSQHVEPYATVIGHFREALKEASLVISIGCSFRDGYLRSVILEKMTEREGLQLLVVDPQAGEVLLRSDRLYGASWRFTSFSERTCLLHLTAREALEGRVLLEQAQAFEDFILRSNEHTRALLAANYEEAALEADLCIEDAVKLRHAGAIGALLRRSATPSSVHGKIALAIRRQSPEEMGAFRWIGPAILLATLSTEDRFRLRASDWLVRVVRWATEYVVWKRGESLAVNLVGNRNPGFEDHRDFFREHAARARACADEVLRWANAMKIAVAEDIAARVAELAEDIGTCAMYFDDAAKDKQYRTASGGFRGSEFHVPRSMNDTLIAELGERFDSESNVPLSLTRLTASPAK